MTATTVTSREFDRDAARAKRDAKAGPVFITDRGRPACVLLSIEDYRRLAGGRRSLLDMLAMPGLDDIGFEPPRGPGRDDHRAVRLKVLRPVSAGAGAFPGYRQAFPTPRTAPP